MFLTLRLTNNAAVQVISCYIARGVVICFQIPLSVDSFSVPFPRNAVSGTYDTPFSLRTLHLKVTDVPVSVTWSSLLRWQLAILSDTLASSSTAARCICQQPGLPNPLGALFHRHDFLAEGNRPLFMQSCIQSLTVSEMVETSRSLRPQQDLSSFFLRSYIYTSWSIFALSGPVLAGMFSTHSLSIG